MRYILSLLLLIAVITLSSVTNDIPQESIATSKHHCKKCKIKRGKCPIKYSANSVGSYNLILYGDVEMNPGPDSYAKDITLKCRILCAVKQLIRTENV